jgi:hypothetical protein
MGDGYSKPNSWRETVTYHTGGNPYVETDSVTPLNASCLYNPGTDSGSKANKISAVVGSDVAANGIEVEIWDIDHATQIAVGAADPAPDTPTILHLTMTGPEPETECVWGVRYKRASGTGYVRLYSIVVERA